MKQTAMTISFNSSVNNNQNGEQRMTSLEIAQLSGKQHKDVLKAIRNMESAWEKVNGLKFQLVEYKDAKGQLRPCYQLTKTECLYIATKFNDEARAKLVLRWQELELQEQERRQQQHPPHFEILQTRVVAGKLRARRPGNDNDIQKHKRRREQPLARFRI